MSHRGAPARAGSPAPARDELAGRRVLVMGLGSFGGGVGAVRYLARHGARVLVTDLRPEPELSASLEALAGHEFEAVLGEHRPADFAAAELVVVNPAVRPDHPLLAAARESGARITSEIELALEVVRARVVCVTGTQGKSSTSDVLHQLLEASGIRAHLGGNIGGSLLDRAESMQAGDACVLELSSYQLETLDTERVRRAGCNVRAVAVTNVLVDHLERHGSPAAYAAAKRRLLELVAEDGAAFLPGDDPALMGWSPPRGRRIDHGSRAEHELLLADGRFRLAGETLGRAADVRLPGDFQLSNVLLALGLARFLGAEPDLLAAALGGLRGLPHRLEDLGRVRGRRVLDNGVSTTPDSTVAALESVNGCTLLLGGRLKDLALEELAHAAREHARLLVTFGEGREALAEALASSGVPVLSHAGLAEAARAALEGTPPDGVLLFSPACASFDAYPNFRARAADFRRVLGLPEIA